MPVPFGSATVPVTSVPMRLFSIVPPPAFMSMPKPWFPEMTFLSAAVGPPIVRIALATWIPLPFGTAVVPVASVPM